MSGLITLYDLSLYMNEKGEGNFTLSVACIIRLSVVACIKRLRFSEEKYNGK
jgi:hypothetical protein